MRSIRGAASSVPLQILSEHTSPVVQSRPSSQRLVLGDDKQLPEPSQTSSVQRLPSLHKEPAGVGELSQAGGMPESKVHRLPSAQVSLQVHKLAAVSAHADFHSPVQQVGKMAQTDAQHFGSEQEGVTWMAQQSSVPGQPANAMTELTAWGGGVFSEARAKWLANPSGAETNRTIINENRKQVPPQQSSNPKWAINPYSDDSLSWKKLQGEYHVILKWHFLIPPAA